MKYDAFVSYRHLERDKFVAKGIHRALETSRIPWKIRKETGKKRINRVFRDQEELPIGSELGSNIELALSESEHLVVICTPQTKESYWVMKEIDTFIAMHGRDNVLAVLAEGEPSESFPPQLLVDDEGNPVEPLAADVRGDSKREISKKIKSESLRLVAAILGCDYDDLKQRHRERIVRRSMAIIAGVAVLSIAFAIYNAYNLQRINENYQKMLVKESKVLAEMSIDALEKGDRQTAGLLAMEGLPVNGKDRPLVSDCIYALERATNSFDRGNLPVHDLILKHDLELRDFKVNNDGSRLVSYDDDFGVYWWDLTTGERILKRNPETIEGSENFVYAVGENDGNMVVVSRKFLTAFDEAGDVVYDVKFGDESCGNAYIDDNNKYAVVVKSSSYADGSLQIYDLTDGSLVRKFDRKGEREFSVESAHFNSDYSLLLVHQWEFDSEDPTTLNVLNLKTGANTEFAVKEETVMDCIFTADNNLAVVSTDRGYELGPDPCPIFVQKFDMNTGEEIFSRELELHRTYYPPYVFAEVTINSRIYQGDDGEEKDLVVTANSSLYNLDLDTGEIKLKYTAVSDIERITLFDESEMMLVGTFDGNILDVSAKDGSVTQEITYFTSEEMRDYFIGRGHVISRDLSTPNLVVMSVLPDPEGIDYSLYDGNIVNYIAASPSGRTFLANAFEGVIGGSYFVYVFDTESGEELGSFSYDDVSFDHAFYKDEDTIIMLRDDMAICQYTISTGETEDISFLDESDRFDTVVSDDGRYLLYYDLHDYYVVDLASNSVVNHFTDEERKYYFYECALVDDGKRVIGKNTDDEALGLDLESGEWTVYNTDYYVKSFGASRDGKYVAVSCTDGMMRIIDTEENIAVQEFDFYGDEYSSGIRFSEDDRLLFLQGRDMIFRVYDVVKEEYIFISDVQMKEISYVKYDKASNTVAISDHKEMYIIDLDDRGFLHYIPEGRVFIPSSGEVICHDDYNVFKYKVRSMDELVDFFYDQFDVAELTDEQKIRYKIY
ncbi:TIR domain-containing protein [Butyrivibrio sp. FCS014]|uniref:TIR domain-containing protein n=1 Tax=Butyrivibrio sp. FCS014 TaxID=1408304 RepID=UPI000464E516|nr:TIR domain-containing protein [Butyrivibrio sp. FCS014]